MSVIVPTRNSSETLEACIESIARQSYEDIELVVIDNNSTDNTKAIAKQYTKHVLNKGPERSAQRNYGAKKASGDYVLFIDSDMELTPNVVSSCVTYANKNRGSRAIIIPEESFGEGFWAQCKKLERSFYVGIDAIEAARFFEKELYLKLGGYDEDMVSGEDWDLSKRVAKMTRTGRINEFILHNEGRLRLIKSLKKKYYYAGLSRTYMQRQNVQSKLIDSVGPIQRYKLFLSQPGKLFKNPLYGLGVLFMKTSEFAAGFVGLYVGKDSKQFNK